MKKVFKILLYFIIASMAIGVFVTVFSSEKEQSAEQLEAEKVAEKANAEAENIELLKSGAYIAAKKLIESSLKAPSTAKFAQYGYGDNPATVVLQNGIYSVNIWVDAQNSFGAMLRNKYKVDIKIDGENWKLVEINKLD